MASGGATAASGLFKGPPLFCYTSPVYMDAVARALAARARAVR